MLEKLIDDHNFTPAKIYNVDETWHSTVETTSKVLSTKGKRQVGVTTSAERGSTRTGVYCHSGTGNYLAPMLVFRRKRICNSLKTDAPAGTIFACTNSGWIDSDCFVMWLKHFIKSVNSSMNNKHLLLLGGHASHTKNLEAIRLARDKGVTMLSFPPHTTHTMQPLDVSLFKSLKNWYNIEIEKFLRTHSGQAIDGSTDRCCVDIVTNERALLSGSDQPVRKLGRPRILYDRRENKRSMTATFAQWHMVHCEYQQRIRTKQ